MVQPWFMYSMNLDRCVMKDTEYFSLLYKSCFFIYSSLLPPLHAPYFNKLKDVLEELLLIVGGTHHVASGPNLTLDFVSTNSLNVNLHYL